MRRDIKIGAADAGDLAEGSHAGRNVLPFAWLVGGKFLLLKSTSMFEGEQSLLYHQELLAGFLTGLLPFKIGTRKWKKTIVTHGYDIAHTIPVVSHTVHVIRLPQVYLLLPPPFSPTGG
ncbi:hypothetical protein MUK42_35028 [Musa troglodytarum]|uniref:Uncharacterized protein n=1 Tax=Musa troglodytarum TaxID=320322 RepID=A0A9E7KJF4_9LILI|nr:hypothetical protein MUK42_35028 [Musa troglodytarum]